MMVERFSILTKVSFAVLAILSAGTAILVPVLSYVCDSDLMPRLTSDDRSYNCIVILYWMLWSADVINICMCVSYFPVVYCRGLQYEYDRSNELYYLRVFHVIYPLLLALSVIGSVRFMHWVDVSDNFFDTMHGFDEVVFILSVAGLVKLPFESMALAVTVIRHTEVTRWQKLFESSLRDIEAKIHERAERYQAILDRRLEQRRQMTAATSDNEDPIPSTSRMQ